MKRTDLERKERDLKKMHKKIDRLSNLEKNFNDQTVGGSINQLSDLFQYDDVQIYNIHGNEDILELLIQLQENFNESQMDNIIRKAIKKTKVKEKVAAFNEIKALM